jgi:BirA family biotin operon repressor/biotin-[acetyl-CoA-carboxylase] ligase
MPSNQWDTLRLLKKNYGTFCTGPDLASHLRISRTAVWKHIKKLNALGYEIVSHPQKGYQLVHVPDLLIPQEIVPHLETSWLGKDYHYFSRIGSTNDHALQLANQGAPHGCLVIAEEQTHGKGRLKRSWLSLPRRGIYMSMILRTPLAIQQAPQSALVAALALVKVLSTQYHLSVTVKWPNDILIQGKKVAGILTEMQSDQDMIRFLIMGIGINVNHTAAELEGPLRYPATSLAIELGNSINRQELLLRILHQFEKGHERFLKEGFAAIVPEMERSSEILGKKIKIHCGSEVFWGKATGFTSQGALRLLTEENTEKIIWVGDVTQVEGNFSNT